MTTTINKLRQQQLTAGMLRHEITIQTRTVSENSLGEDVGGWADFSPEWAEAVPIRGREYFAASQIQSAIDVKFTIRYRTDITDTMRVIWQGDAYDIVSPPIDIGGAGFALELLCTKGVRDGRA